MITADEVAEADVGLMPQAAELRLQALKAALETLDGVGGELTADRPAVDPWSARSWLRQRLLADEAG